MSIEEWSSLIFPDKEGKDVHVYGSVRSINSDGSYEVQLNASSTTTRCAPCCTAMVGDRVLVCIKANGKCDAIGRLGGETSSLELPIPVSSGGTGSTWTGGAANNLQVYSINNGTDIPANSNLDNYKTIGNYVCGSSKNAATMSNIPVSSAFTMKVYGSTGSDYYPAQELTEYITGNKYQRTYNTDRKAWEPWHCSSGVDSVVAQGKSGIWDYIKLNSGIAILSTYYVETDSHYSTYNGMYAYYTATKAFPFDFVSEPGVGYGAFIGSGFAISARAVVSTTDISFFYLASASGSQEIQTHAIVMGRWK